MTLDDIKEILKTQNIKKGIYGTYDVTPIEPNDFGLDVYDVIDFLQENFMEIEHPFGKQWSFDDVFYEEEGTEDFNIQYPDDKTWNSYNWNGAVVMQAVAFFNRGAEFVAVRFHKYGDARCNYTNFVVLATDWERFNERMHELYWGIMLCNNSYDVEQYFMDEDGLYRVWDNEREESFEVRLSDLDDNSIDIPFDLRSEMQKYIKS